MALKPSTVTQINEYISSLMTNDWMLSNVPVRGEVSGVNYHSSGHVYFSLVDKNSKLRCFLSKYVKSGLDFRITDGMDLILTGSISVFVKGGYYSLFVKSIEQAGEGALAAAFEKMKRKLDDEGLFDSKCKKPIPAFPKTVGIVTASTGAAIRDIQKTIKSRNDVVDMILFPVKVQGEGAAADIARGIETANVRFPDLDVLIVGRGGGSAEDLKAFNEEIVARSIFDSKIPVISAVGHEIDLTIADLVADCRAATPTAAGQIAVPDTSELMNKIENMRDTIAKALYNTVNYKSISLDNIYNYMKNGMSLRVTAFRSKLNENKAVLRENNPRNVLVKGYVILDDGKGHFVTKAEDINIGDKLKINLVDGSADCNITKVGG